jgi:hypothetical protein
MRTLLALAFGLSLLVPASSSAATHTLVATVGTAGAHDAFKITLTSNGKRVTHLRAGTYTIVVHDYSKIHNFALGSIAKNRRIFTGSVPGTATKSYRVTLTPGSYAYACSAHPSTMNGRFTVT